mgnify:CR=1 FL=1
MEPFTIELVPHEGKGDYLGQQGHQILVPIQFVDIR